MSDLQYPGDLRYTTEHEWVRRLDDGVLRIGITAFAQDALGDVVFVSLPAVDDELAPGAACGEVESTKSVSDVFSPVAGTVTAVNNALNDTPELINSDPYGQGWMFEIRTHGDNGLEGLLDADAYQAQLV